MEALERYLVQKSSEMISAMEEREPLTCPAVTIYSEQKQLNGAASADLWPSYRDLLLYTSQWKTMWQRSSARIFS